MRLIRQGREGGFIGWDRSVGVGQAELERVWPESVQGCTLVLNKSFHKISKNMIKEQVKQEMFDFWN